ncbi:MAG TPA: type II secretion system protein GspM [Solirubrobacteraceae bacterium]|nr:type II secretion system protein GspM [Solirubrobacteraceae bacterium]
MTTRDRLVLAVVAALAVLGAFWVLLVSPQRKTANKLSSEVSAASAQLATVKGEAANALVAQQRYSAAYSSVVSLGKAVPPSEEVPSLIYQLAQASNRKNVEFSSITAGASGATTPSPSSAATPATAPAGFTQMPFTFVFNGGFSDLYHLFLQLNKATVRTTSGGLRVSGRLLTLQGVKLEPAAETASGPSGAQKLTGTITATAYVLPATQSLTGGATASSPTTATAPASSATSSATSSSTSAPAATVEPLR